MLFKRFFYKLNKNKHQIFQMLKSFTKYPGDKIVSDILMYFNMNNHATVSQFLSKKIRKMLFTFEDAGKYTYL